MKITDLTDVLKQALIGGGVDTLHGEVASKIKGQQFTLPVKIGSILISQ